jgi:hypothetical protein
MKSNQEKKKSNFRSSKKEKEGGRRKEIDSLQTLQSLTTKRKN